MRTILKSITWPFLPLLTVQQRRNFPGFLKHIRLRYQLVDNTIADKDLRNKGFYMFCVLRMAEAV
jgi:hypothetical protein